MKSNLILKTEESKNFQLSTSYSNFYNDSISENNNNNITHSNTFTQRTNNNNNNIYKPSLSLTSGNKIIKNFKKFFSFYFR